MYHTISELLSLAQSCEAPLWRIILENETALSGLPETEIYRLLEKRLQVMEASARKALEHPLPTVGGLIEGIASRQFSYASAGGGICGSAVNHAMALALSCSETNASMGKICAAPTAGACGILPAVLLTMGEQTGCERIGLLRGLATASGVGAIITKNATVSGAEGGCQAECGVAAAMSAAAAVELRGGTPAMAVNACSLALMNCMGLVCDPVAGLVQVPCAQRNASQTVNALLSADLALGGMECVIPPDEMVEAMLRVGRMLPPALKETAGGGIAATRTGREIYRKIFQAG